MGYDGNKFSKKNFMYLKNSNLSTKMKKFLVHNRNELISAELGGLNKSDIIKNIQNEFTNKYKQIYSFYLEKDRIELTNSTTKIDKEFSVHEPISEKYEDAQGFMINFIWTPEEKGFNMRFFIYTEFEELKWNFRKIESRIPDEFLSLQKEVVRNLEWNMDYCIDILPISGDIISIWICLRDYSN